MVLLPMLFWWLSETGGKGEGGCFSVCNSNRYRPVGGLATQSSERRPPRLDENTSLCNLCFHSHSYRGPRPAAIRSSVNNQ